MYIYRVNILLKGILYNYRELAHIVGPHVL